MTRSRSPRGEPSGGGAETASPASCLDKTFRYTPVAQQGEQYLKRKFDKIRREQKAEAEAKVRQFPKKAHERG
jgi:hypothetical protein